MIQNDEFSFSLHKPPLHIILGDRFFTVWWAVIPGNGSSTTTSYTHKQTYIKYIITQNASTNLYYTSSNSIKPF